MRCERENVELPLRAVAAAVRALLRTSLHPGTNGWLSLWGTNAHGEIAGCPPARALRAAALS